MSNLLFALFLLGTVVWGVVQWVRHKRLSYLATTGTSIFLIGAFLTRHPLTYVGAFAMILVRWWLLAKERRPGASVPGAFGLPKLGAKPTEPGNPLGLELAPARLPGESTEKMIERHLGNLRESGEDYDYDELVAHMSAHRAFKELDIEELRPVFRLVSGGNRPQRELAAELIAEKGDDDAIGALREASARHADLAEEFQKALCARGSEALATEKELYFRDPNSTVRQRALTALVSGACTAEAGSLAAKAGLDRVLVALVAETDKDILLKVVRHLYERGHLDALTAEFGKLPAWSRRTIIERFPVGQPTLEVTELYRVALRDADSSVAGAARAVVRRAGFEELRAELEQPATALEGWTRLTIKTAAAVVPCDGGGQLKIEPGDLDVRARFEHLTVTEIDTIRVKLVLADSEGREWGLVSYFQGGIFTDDFVEDDRREALEKENAFEFWSDVPEAWGDALKERCLVAGAGELLDHRFYFDLRIGAQTLTLQMKHQGPKIDIAALESELVVRVSELYQILYKGEGEQREFDDIAPVPPFAWLAPLDRLLCFTEPRTHYATLEEMDEVDPGGGEPSRAKRLESTREAQLGVVFEPE